MHDTPQQLIRVYCESFSPFHEKHGKTWHQAFAHDGVGWHVVPSERSRVSPENPGGAEFGDVHVPSHTVHYAGEPRAAREDLFDLYLSSDESAALPPTGHPLRSATITFNWRCPCGNALDSAGDRLVPVLDAFAEAGHRDLSLDLLRGAIGRPGR